MVTIETYFCGCDNCCVFRKGELRLSESTTLGFRCALLHESQVKCTCKLLINIEQSFHFLQLSVSHFVRVRKEQTSPSLPSYSLQRHRSYGSQSLPLWNAEFVFQKFLLCQMLILILRQNQLATRHELTRMSWDVRSQNSLPLCGGPIVVHEWRNLSEQVRLKAWMQFITASPNHFRADNPLLCSLRRGEREGIVC